MRPSGPLPPRVYWVRRLLLLVVLVVVISMVWWAVQKVTGSAEESTAGPTGTASSGADGDEASEADTSVQDPSEQDPSEQDADDPSDAAGDERGRGDKERGRQPNRSELRAPTGPCAVGDIDVDIEVSDVRQGRRNEIVLLFTGPPRSACDLGITPDTLAIRITSGDDVVWSSDACPDKLLARQLVVRDRPAARYTFTWDGRRSTGSCAGTGQKAMAGGYWVETALIGAAANEAYFDVLA